MERKTRTQILREVKERLATGNYTEIHKLRSINTTDRIITLGNVLLNDKDVFEYYEKVLALQNDEFAELSAIGKLINQDVFDAMNDSQKQMYVLDLSKLYLALKEECKDKIII
ncbi:MAG: hypothetical protein IJD50_03460 [Clostridia bacterium]|nr:hypothetical protein [Clostridia bacterium]